MDGDAWEVATRDGDTIEMALTRPAAVADPDSLYASLRRQDPVHRSPSGDWFLVGYRHVEDILRSRHGAWISVSPRRRVPAGRAPHLHALLGGSPIYLDAPAHTAQRQALAPHFTPAAVVVSRVPDIVTRADQLLDAAASGPQGAVVDLLSAFAQRLTRRTMIDVLGIPVADDAAAARWENRVAAVALVADPLPTALSARRVERADTAAEKITATIAEAITNGAVTPGTAFESLLTWAEATGAPVGEVAGALALVFGAGHFTSLNLLSVALWELLCMSPGERTEIVVGGEGVRGPLHAFVDEVARLVSPVATAHRTPTDGACLDGASIPSGDPVVLVFAAADRDPERFESPDEIRLDRRTPNLAFGRGEHHCIGVHLARAQAAAALTRFVTRFPDAELEDKTIEWRGVGNSRRVTHVRAHLA